MPRLLASECVSHYRRPMFSLCEKHILRSCVFGPVQRNWHRTFSKLAKHMIYGHLEISAKTNMEIKVVRRASKTDGNSQHVDQKHLSSCKATLQAPKYTMPSCGKPKPNRSRPLSKNARHLNNKLQFALKYKTRIWRETRAHVARATGRRVCSQHRYMSTSMQTRTFGTGRWTFYMSSVTSTTHTLHESTRSLGRVYV